MIHDLIMAGSIYGRSPPSYVAAAQTHNGATNTNTLVISKPTGTQQYDLMIAVMAIGFASALTWTGDTGWTEILDQNASPDLRIAYKVAGASEGSSYTFTCSSSVTALTGCILTYRGADYDAIGTIGTAASGGNCTAGAVTASSDNSILLAAFAINAIGGITFPTPSGMSLVTEYTGANQGDWAIFSQAVNTGSSGTKSCDPSGASGAVSGVLLSIKPA